MRCENVTQNVLFGNVVFTALMSGRKYVIQQNGNCSRESNVYLGFSKQSILSKHKVVTELNMKKIHLQTTLLPSQMDIQ
jgi:hypothetical protein